MSGGLKSSRYRVEMETLISLTADLVSMLHCDCTAFTSNTTYAMQLQCTMATSWPCLTCCSSDVSPVAHQQLHAVACNYLMVFKNLVSSLLLDSANVNLFYPIHLKVHRPRIQEGVVQNDCIDERCKLHIDDNVI